jgi:hypothetical protein
MKFKHLLKCNSYANHIYHDIEDNLLLENILNRDNETHMNVNDFIYMTSDQQIHLIFHSTMTLHRLMSSILTQPESEISIHQITAFLSATRDLAQSNSSAVLSRIAESCIGELMELTMYYDDDVRPIATAILLRLASRTSTRQEVISAVKHIYHASYDMMVYIDMVKGYTFETEHTQLSDEYKNIIVNAHEGKKVDPEVLITTLQQMIDRVGGSAFVKLSTRSPKDAIDAVCKNNAEKAEQLESTIKQKIKSTKNADESLIEKNCRAQMMRVTNGSDAFDLLQYSDRVYEDIMNQQQTTLHILMRKWIDIPVELELRAFVCRGKLTALSQYYTQGVFQVLHQHKLQIEELVREFTNELLKEVPYHNCVLDLALVPDETKVFKVVLVEINPFGKSAGAALFSWVDDRNVLVGNSNFEFRLQ